MALRCSSPPLIRPTLPTMDSHRGGVVAAVCRDHDGHYLSLSATVFPFTNKLQIFETYACREALALAENIAVQDICVASDCQGVVNDISKGT
uniref:RNase H type-1 domain-containing protein n=1 Tax=Hordeum vulgare subsp. vulgare TaxID=112509 RepID=A0A8I6YNN2_HORVV